MIYITKIHLVGGASNAHIANVEWRNPDDGKTGESSREDVITWIDSQKGVAKVTDGANTVNVGVVKASPPYLRTHADGAWTDNLLALPRF